MGQFVEMGPEQLLAQVAARPERQAHDAGIGAEGFDRLGVIAGHAPIMNLAGEHFDAIHLGPGGQRADQLQHVRGLPAGIWITAELQVLTPEQTVQMQMQEVKPHGTP